MKTMNYPINNITLNENDPIFNVLTYAGKDNYPFILKGHRTIDKSEPVEMYRFYKKIDQPTQPIEKVVDIYDESPENVFSGEMLR